LRLLIGNRLVAGRARLYPVICNSAERQETTMEKFLMGGAGYVFTLVGIVLAVTVGVMSILLPIIVFRIMSKVSSINDKMNRTTTLLGEMIAATKALHNQRSAEEIRNGAYAPPKSVAPEVETKSLRYK
jgi:competence protein ComGC